MFRLLTQPQTHEPRLFDFTASEKIEIPEKELRPAAQLVRMEKKFVRTCGRGVQTGSGAGEAISSF